jgi:FtsP/CotA-like multicopper oxidase with cupredoxin domain
VSLVLLCVVPLLASAGIAFYRHLQPVVIGAAADHHAAGHLAAGGSGGGAVVSGDAVSVAELRTSGDPGSGPVVRFALTARQQQVTLPSGRVVDAWTFGSLPGPEIRVRTGDLVEVTVTNADIADGVTLHWHGYRVPNGEDGVAGVTQDAVAPGESFIYRFVATDPGTYWYHAHQVSSEAVARGLFGALIVDPVAAQAVTDLVVPVHTFDGIPVLGDTDGVLARTVAPGEPVRVRLINTDPIPHRISADGTAVTVTAVDGTDLTGPTPVGGQVLRIPAGGRYDVTFAMPDGPVAFGVEGAPETGLRLSPIDAPAAGMASFVDGADLDLLDYGSSAPTAGFSRDQVTREAVLVLDRQFRFLNGIPTLAQTVNGEVHPFVPPIPVGEGDLLRLTVVNRGGETHPMHPHGHRVLVESRNGEAVRGSPLWLDTFDVQPGEVWTVLLRADNPGIWMAHCHNLEHATQGMVVHLTYQGVSTPFMLGGGPADNRPE